MKPSHGQDPKLFDQGGLLRDACDAIVLAMESSGVSRNELARRVGCSRAHVTMVLCGTRNMTLRTLAQFAYALGYDVHVRLLRRK